MSNTEEVRPEETEHTCVECLEPVQKEDTHCADCFEELEPAERKRLYPHLYQKTNGKAAAEMPVSNQQRRDKLKAKAKAQAEELKVWEKPLEIETNKPDVGL